MATKFNPIIGTLLAVVATVLLHVSNAQGGRKEGTIGGWKPITNLTDPKVVGIGKFAVGEHNKETKTKLEFQEIVKGESQVADGTNYRLVITAEDSGSPHNYLAEVWDKPEKKLRNVTSFEECSIVNGEQKCTFT